MRLDDREVLAKPGEGIIIPSNVWHEFESLEEGIIDLDFFALRRQDWLDGTDTYSSGKPA